MGISIAIAVVFFILMPVLAVAVCCYIYNKDDANSQVLGLKTERTPLV